MRQNILWALGILGPVTVSVACGGITDSGSGASLTDALSEEGYGAVAPKACHANLKATTGEEITIQFQVRSEAPAITGAGPQHDDYAVNGLIRVARGGFADSDEVVANLRAYCVSGRLPRDAAYERSGVRCEENDATGINLEIDGNKDATASVRGNRFLFETVDFAGTSRHVLYDIEILVNGTKLADPIGGRDNFRFDFQGPFLAQGSDGAGTSCRARE